jgi:hypothetical protein
MLAACSEDCVCKAATVSVGACTNEGGSAHNCLLELLTANGPAAQDEPFIVLQQCQISTCEAACASANSADAGDAGGTDAAVDSGPEAATGDAAPDGEPDAVGGDAAADGEPDVMAGDAAPDGEPDAVGDAGTDGD